MMRLLQSGWMTMLVGTLLYLGTSFFFLDLGHVTLADGTQIATPQGRQYGASWEFLDPEVDRLVQELMQEKTALAQQREQLTQWAKRLEAERAELTSATQAIAQLRSDFDQTYVRVQGEEAKNLKRLSKMFATMAPETSLHVMDQLGEDEMAKLLAIMKDEQVTAILELLASKGEEQAKRAAALAGRLKRALVEDAKP
jgi:flagellar motility protein MotE (MotC chaperone)